MFNRLFKSLGEKSRGEIIQTTWKTKTAKMGIFVT